MKVESCISVHREGKCSTRAVDAPIAALATGQHGVVSRSQQLASGVSPGQIEHRIERARLHRVHTGVYAVGHRAVAREARWMAAVLAAGSGAVLSHRAAAALWAVRPSAGQPEVTAARSRRSRRGLIIHRAALPADESTFHRGIAVTTVPRTIFDLAAVVDGRQVENASNEAEMRRLTDPLSLHDLVERHPHSRGVATIHRLLGERTPSLNATRSEPERAFLAFRRDHGLPVPEVNALIAVGDRSYIVDFL